MKKSTKILIGVSAVIVIAAVLFVVLSGNKNNNTSETSSYCGTSNATGGCGCSSCA